MPTHFFPTAGSYNKTGRRVIRQSTPKSGVKYKMCEFCKGLQICDVSPIENIWKLVKDKVEKKCPKNKNMLREYIETAAGEISTQTRVNLMKSLPLRFEVCTEAKRDVFQSYILAN